MHALASRRTFAALAALLLASLLAACGKAPDQATSTAKTDAAEKVYLVGADAAYAPFEYQNDKGQIVGFSVDLTNAVASKAGLQVKFVNTPWEGIFNALAQGDRDILVSSITITDERRQSMDFTNPYFDARQLIAVRADSPVKSFADLAPLTVGVQTGTTGDDVVTKLLGKTSTRIRRFESTPLALKELDAGGVDAVVADNGVVINYVKNNGAGKLRMVSDPNFKPEQYGMAVRKGNTALLDKLNRGLAAVRADGSYARIYSQYFGSDAGEPGFAASAPAPAPTASK